MRGLHVASHNADRAEPPSSNVEELRKGASFDIESYGRGPSDPWWRKSARVASCEPEVQLSLRPRWSDVEEMCEGHSQ